MSEERIIAGGETRDGTEHTDADDAAWSPIRVPGRDIRQVKCYPARQFKTYPLAEAEAMEAVVHQLRNFPHFEKDGAYHWYSKRHANICGCCASLAHLDRVKAGE